MSTVVPSACLFARRMAFFAASSACGWMAF
jgi:hypothetical protein